MNRPMQNIEAELLRLPTQRRARLAQVLIGSLDREGEIEEAWIAEAGKRYRAYKTGKLKGIPADQVFKEIRQHFGK